jgi:hypothetical protein
MKKGSAQVQLKEREPEDPHIQIGVCSMFPTTGGSVILRYREANLMLSVIGEGLRNLKMGRVKRKRLGYALVDLMTAFIDGKQKSGGIGVSLELSRAWPGWNADGSRKNEIAPDPTPAKMKDRGQKAKA